MIFHISPAWWCPESSSVHGSRLKRPGQVAGVQIVNTHRAVTDFLDGDHADRAVDLGADQGAWMIENAVHVAGAGVMDGDLAVAARDEGVGCDHRFNGTKFAKCPTA